MDLRLPCLCQQTGGTHVLRDMSYRPVFVIDHLSLHLHTPDHSVRTQFPMCSCTVGLLQHCLWDMANTAACVCGSWGFGGGPHLHPLPTLYYQLTPVYHCISHGVYVNHYPLMHVEAISYCWHAALSILCGSFFCGWLCDDTVCRHFTFACVEWLDTWVAWVTVLIIPH